MFWLRYKKIILSYALLSGGLVYIEGSQTIISNKNCITFSDNKMQTWMDSSDQYQQLLFESPHDIMKQE